MEEKNQSGKDEEIRHLQQELNIYRLKVANLETSLEMAEITVQVSLILINFYICKKESKLDQKKSSHLGWD